MQRIHIFDDFLTIWSRGVVGLPIRCTKMDQNGPKWSPYHDSSKVFRICPEWLIWSFSGLNGHLKGDKSQYKSWRGHGVAHEVHQNGPKRTKIDQNGPKWSPYHDRAKVSWICLEWLIWSFSWLNGHMKMEKSQNKSGRGHVVTHEVHQNAPILVHFGPFWCILVYLMCDPMTPSWLVLTPIPFQVSFNPDKDHISHSGQIQNTFALPY